MKQRALYTAAYDADDRIALVSNARDHGPFRCIGCGKSMVAKRGRERIWHFAHSTEDSCSSETALHKAAKELIADALRRRLEVYPHSALLAGYKCPYCSEEHTVDLMAETSSVEIEMQIGTVIPDIVLKDTLGNPNAAIEVVVSHPPTEAALAFYMDQWGKPVYFISPTWDDLPSLDDHLYLSAILMQPHTCSVRKTLMDKHAKTFSICGRIPSTADHPHGQCQACESVLIPFALQVLADFPCYKCGCVTPIAKIQAESEEACQISADRLVKLGPELQRGWYVDIRADYSHTARATYLMNHCRHCGTKIGDFYLHEGMGIAVVVDCRKLGYCDTCGRWHIGSRHIRSPYLYGPDQDMISIPDQLQDHKLSLKNTQTRRLYVNGNNSDIERLAADLGIAPVPEFWKTHWQEFEEWKSGDGCVRPGEIPSNAQQVFDLPVECMPGIHAICATIRTNPALAELANLWHFLIFHLPGGRGLSEDVLPQPTVALGERAPLFHIAVLVSGTNDVLETYRAMGVSDVIALDSLAQCGGQARDYYAKHGVYGMRFLGWMRNYFLAKMFRLGRLVFNHNTYTWAFHVYRHRTTGELLTLCAGGCKYRADGMADGTNGIHDPNAWVSELEIVADFVRGNPVSPTGEAIRETVTLSISDWEPLITPGDHMVEVHIPPHSSGGRLTWEECVESYRQALEFFPRFYPEMNFKAFTCWSWLLDPGLAKILPPESNIVRFQSPFHLLPVVGSDGQCYDLAFGDTNLDITTVTPRTSLQRAIKDYVLADNRMRSTAGYMTMDEVGAISDFGMRIAD